VTAPVIRVLLADDSSVVRKLVAAVLSADEGIEICGMAGNGADAIAKIEQLQPDALVLDMEMPVMDGLQTLAALRPRWPHLPVIIFSTLTERGATATLDALAAGASDYVTKPTHAKSINEAVGQVRLEIVPKIKALCARVANPPVPATTAYAPAPTQAPSYPAPAPATSLRAHPPVIAPGLDTSFAPAPRPLAPAAPAHQLPATPPVFERAVPAVPSAPPTLARRSGPRVAVELVAIGVSTGGPNALAEVLARIPTDLAVPVVIVQHMPTMFTRLLAERLDRLSPLGVQEVSSPVQLQAGHVYLAEGGRHMVVERRAGALWALNNDAPPENSCRPSVDVLLRSVAAACGARTLAVILTGMGTDGLAGCKVLSAAGATIFAQDDQTSVVWGMPGAVVSAHLAESVLPLDHVAPEIVRAVGRGMPSTADAPRRTVSTGFTAGAPAPTGASGSDLWR
jgi:two-component system chemotaxis response regulator CheB